MARISVYLPDDLEETLEAYIAAETTDRSSAVETLLRTGLEQWRQDRACRKLEAGEVSFTRAAEFADQSVWAFAALLAERDVQWVDGEQLEEDLHENSSRPD